MAGLELTQYPNAYTQGDQAFFRGPGGVAYPYTALDPAAAAGMGAPQQMTESTEDPVRVMQRAYANQEARLGPMRLPSEISNEGLGLPTSTPHPQMSSGGGDFNWLMALGAGLQSAGAAHFGNFGVPQQYFQLKQQRDQIAAQAEERKATFALQQQKLAEEQKQHQWQQVFQVMTNENLGAAQRVETLKGMKTNPYAQEAAQNVNAKMLGDFKAAGEYLPRKPEEYAKALQDGTIDWHQVAAETKMGLQLKQKVVEKQADAMAYQTLQRMAQEQPDNQPLQEAWQEAQKEKLEKIAKANVTIASAPSDIRDRQVKPQIAEADLANKQAPREVASGVLNDQGQVFNDIFDPKTGKTDRVVGTPLQRTQEVPASVASRAMNTIDSVDNMEGTIKTLKELLVTPDGRPRNELVGLVGGLKGMVYGAAAQSDAFAQLLRGGATRIDAHISDTKSDVSKSNFFDPALSKADLLQNLLAYQLAMVNSDGDRVSNDDFKQAKQSLGGGKILNGVEDIMARLDQLSDIAQQRRSIAEKRLSQRGPQQAKPQAGGQPNKEFKDLDEYRAYYGIK